MPELSEEAKAELNEAIRIVREDKQYNMLKEIHGRSGGNPSPAPSSDPPSDPANDDGAPPKKDGEPEPKKRGGIWAVGYEGEEDK